MPNKKIKIISAVVLALVLTLAFIWQKNNGRSGGGEVIDIKNNEVLKSKDNIATVQIVKSDLAGKWVELNTMTL